MGTPPIRLALTWAWRCLAFATTLIGIVGPAGAADNRILLGFEAAMGSEPAIVGSSTRPQFEGWIEATALSYGFTLDSVEGTTLGAPVSDGFAFSKGIDKSSPKLQESVLNGKVFSRVAVVYLGNQSPAPRHAPSTVVLHNVGVSGYEVGGRSAPDGSLTDRTALTFERVDWIYRTSDSRGHVTDETTTGFDLLTAEVREPVIDDDGDGIPNDQDPDSDGDLLPDTFEQQFGLDLLYDDSAEDRDNDGQTNRSEWLTGTRPDDPSSSYGIDRLTYIPDGNQPTASVAFGVVAGRHYRLLGTFDLQTPATDWVVIEEFETAEDSLPAEMEVALPPALVTEMKRMFFKVEVGLPAQN